jgi:serine protease Do
VALGTIVTRDGGILTKASALAKAPSCRLADGRTEPAKVIRISRKDDVALLRIAAVDLPVIQGWDSKDILPVGLLLALPAPTGTTVVGSVACAPRSIRASPKGDEFHHDGFPSAYEVGIPSAPGLNGGPVIDAMGRMRGVVVAVASDGWLIVIPSSSAQNVVHD